MEKVEYYKQILSACKELCASGKQSCFFQEYCREHDVSYYRIHLEYQSLNDIPGYTRDSSLKYRCSQVYEDFKSLCADGRRPGTFINHYKGFGITERQMDGYLKRNRLRVSDLPGYTSPQTDRSSRYKEIPFEDVISEEAGFLLGLCTNLFCIFIT